MASTYSTNLAIELIGTGDQAGSWGNTTNTNLGTLIEQAISGYVTQAVVTGTDTTITIPNGSSGVARNMYIELTGTGGTNTNLIVPANKKLYFIFNNSTGAVTVKVSGQTGVSVPQGKKVVLTSDGTDVVNGLNYIADFGSNSATITQLTATSATITNLTLTSLVISNLSIASANITTLTSTNATAASLTVSTGNLTFSGTAQRITGDMSTATVSNAVLFQTSTTNGTTRVTAIPNGTSAQAQFTALNSSSDPTNASGIQIVATATEAKVQAANFGTGTSLPMTFYTGGSERMRLDTSGNLGIGMTPSTDTLFEVYGSAAATCYKNVNTGTGLSDGFYVGCGKSSSTDAYVYNRESAPLIFGTANAERMRIDSSGNVGIGGTADANAKVMITGTYPVSSNSSRAIRIAGTIPSGTTDNFIGVASIQSTQAASFTLSSLFHFYAIQSTIGSGSAVTNQYGFFAQSSLTGATNNYGFYSDIASGSNRWNFYAAGTAVNYFAGNVRIGTTADLGEGARVNVVTASGEADVETWRYADAAAGKYWRWIIDSNSRIYLTNQGAVGVYINDGDTAWTAYSDERAKADLKPIEDSVNKVCQLRAVTGRFKKDEEGVSRSFLIAQDVQKVFPEAVSDINPDELGVRYTDMIPLLVAAIKEQQAIIEQLKADVAALKGA